MLSTWTNATISLVYTLQTRTDAKFKICKFRVFYNSFLWSWECWIIEDEFVHKSNSTKWHFPKLTLFCRVLVATSKCIAFVWRCWWWYKMDCVTSKNGKRDERNERMYSVFLLVRYACMCMWLGIKTVACFVEENWGQKTASVCIISSAIRTKRLCVFWDVRHPSMYSAGAFVAVLWA